MKNILLLSFLVGQLILAGSSANAERSKALASPQEACSFDGTICDFYCYKANELGCAKDTYLLQFGQKYCRRYIRNSSKFSDRVQAVLAKIRSCLVDRLENQRGLTCVDAEVVGMHSHVSCYVDSGFCGLAKMDQFQIFWLANELIFNENVRHEMGQVDQLCSKKKE